MGEKPQLVLLEENRYTVRLALRMAVPGETDPVYGLALILRIILDCLSMEYKHASEY
jgi:hypothetical protein